MSSTVKPADAHISVVLADLRRYENQNFSNAATVKRTLKMLPLSEERLMQSSNQDDPSWIAAKEQLDALKTRLQSEEPVGAPAPVVPSTTPITSTTAPVPAPSSSTPNMISSDRCKVQKLQRDIAFAQQTLNRDGIERLNDSNYRNRMEASSNRFASQLAVFAQYAEDPDVAQAQQALNDFKESLESSSHQAGVFVPPTPSAMAPPAEAETMITQDRIRVQKMKRDLESAQRMIDHRRLVADPVYIQNLLSSVENYEATLKTYDKYDGDPDVVSAKAALELYKGALASAQEQAAFARKAEEISKVKKEIDLAYRSIQQAGPKPFQDRSNVEEHESTIRQVGEHVLPLATAYEEDSEVLALVAALQELRQLFETYKIKGSEAAAQFADVKAELQEMKTFAQARTIKAPEQPYTEESMILFFEEAQKMEQKVEKYTERVEKIASEAYLPDVNDRNTISEIKCGLSDHARKIERESQIIEATVNQKVDLLDCTLKWFDKLDPNDRNDQANAFFGECGAHFQRNRLDAELQAAKSGVVYATKMQPEQLDKFQDAVERIERTRQEYETKLQMSVAFVRMPKPVSPRQCSYEELEAIAQDTLANPKYGVGPIVRMVVNSDKKVKRREEKELKFKSDYATTTAEEIVTVWEWTEFQVATAEAEGESHFIYYNTLKFFTSGSAVTPLDKWVVGDRFKSVEIPLENIQKD